MNYPVVNEKIRTGLPFQVRANNKNKVPNEMKSMQ